MINRVDATESSLAVEPTTALTTGRDMLSVIVGFAAAKRTNSFLWPTICHFAKLWLALLSYRDRPLADVRALIKYVETDDDDLPKCLLASALKRSKLASAFTSAAKQYIEMVGVAESMENGVKAVQEAMERIRVMPLLDIDIDENGTTNELAEYIRQFVRPFELALTKALELVSVTKTNVPPNNGADIQTRIKNATAQLEGFTSNAFAIIREEWKKWRRKRRN